MRNIWNGRQCGSNDKDRFDLNLRTEYQSLASYYGTIITIRFTTAGLFLTAAGLFITKADPKDVHFGILLVFTIGTWIVELRNRSIFRKILERAYEIEYLWGYPDNDERFAFFGNMTRHSARKYLKGRIPNVMHPDNDYAATRILWFRPTKKFGKYITHTVGLDILFAAVFLYSLHGLFETNWKDRFMSGANYDQAAITAVMRYAILAILMVLSFCIARVGARMAVDVVKTQDKEFARKAPVLGWIVTIAGIAGLGVIGYWILVGAQGWP